MEQKILDETNMLTNENILRWLPSTNIKQTVTNAIPCKKSKIKNDRDDLFWLLYHIVNEDKITSESFSIEKNFKISCIEKLRGIKSKLKLFKFKLNELENILLNEKKINHNCFFALALLFNINIFYIWNNKYYEFLNSDSEDIYLLDINNEIIKNSNKLDYYKANYFHIENLNKPINAITSYSKEDLILMTKKLQINNISDKPTKKELYEKILQKL